MQVGFDLVQVLVQQYQRAYRGGLWSIHTQDQYKADPAKYANAEVTRLRHRVKDEATGLFHSEVIVSALAAKVYNLSPGQILTPDQALAFGVRIPTQDKHSMVNIKIVDVLPPETGNVVILPKEIITLSGADMDIDALYVHQKELFDETTAYGAYYTASSPVKSAFNEQRIYVKKTSRAYKKELDKLAANDARLKNVENDIARLQRTLQENPDKEAELAPDLRELYSQLQRAREVVENQVLININSEVKDLATFRARKGDIIKRVKNNASPTNIWFGGIC